jgi:hypothetical protein
MNEHMHQKPPGQGEKQTDDSQDELGSDVNDTETGTDDEATVKPTEDEAAKAERAHEASRLIELQRQHKRADNGDDEQKVTGGFNQRH